MSALSIKTFKADLNLGDIKL